MGEYDTNDIIELSDKGKKKYDWLKESVENVIEFMGDEDNWASYLQEENFIERPKPKFEFEKGKEKKVRQTTE